MIRLLTILLTLLAGPALATQDGWPALHDVVGVAADDVLNVRSGPGASFPVVGSLGPGARDVEVIAPAAADDGWGIVNLPGEGPAGYVSLRFLRRQANTFAGHLPPVLHCAGTEPFWSLRVAGDRIDYADPAPGRDRTFLGIEMLDTGRYGAEPVLRAFEGADAVTVVLQNRARAEGHDLSAHSLDGLCSDGMSDRAFGLSVTAVTVIGGRALARSGCCGFEGP
ncbi:MAG: peptide-binding protein [Hasllibacter sp.]